MPYLTGDTIPSASRCKVVRIPDDLTFLGALNGAILELTRLHNWETHGTITAQEMADAWFAIYEAYTVEECMHIPVGATMEWWTATAPEKWLFVRGQSLLRADYPDLFAVLGTTFGADDSTHFSLPQMIDRSPMGATGDLVPALGQHQGQPTVTLNSSQNGIHTHLTTEVPHSHPERLGTGNLAAFQGAGSGGFAISGAASGTATRISTDAVSTGLTIQNSAGGTPHTNLHPVTGVNFIIYAGV